MAHTTVFAHNKGGTGKTTACVNIAGFLQQRDKHVLVVDTDAQANATSNLGLDPDALDTSLYDVLMDEAGISDVDLKDCVYPTEHGIDIMPGSLRLQDAYKMLWEEDGRNEFLSNALYALGNRYDHILIDTPPTELNVVSAGIRAADSFYLVMDSSVFSRDGAGALKKFLRRLPDQHTILMNPTRVLLTEHKERSLLNQLKNKFLVRDPAKRSERVARSMFGTRFKRVPYCEDVILSQQQGKPLSHLERAPDEADVFDELAQDLIEYSW